jgi:hypothetical protein
LFDQKTLLDVSQKKLKNRFPAFPSSPGNQRQGLPTIFIADYAPSFRGTKVFICFSGHCPAPREPGFWQAVEKRTSAAFPSSFAVQRTRKYASRLGDFGGLASGRS